jgi:hypothetical protein
MVTSGTVAAPLEYESRIQRTAVLELFTSHGCSSCPPADAWLRRFVNHPDLWSRFIPMAFHVDYWNGLGWPDRFASPAYSDRQRSYHQIGAIGSVYTPGFVLSGKEWRGWFRRHSPGLSLTEEVGRLKVVVESGKGATATFRPGDTLERGPLTAHMAVLGFGLNSSIGAGENSGRTLQEDFVVLGVSSADPDQGRWLWQLRWPDIRETESSRLALVVWLSRPGDPAPVQAAGGWLHSLGVHPERGNEDPR